MDFDTGMALTACILSAYACWAAYNANKMAREGDPLLWQPRLVLRPIAVSEAAEEEPPRAPETIKGEVTNPGGSHVSLHRGWLTAFRDMEQDPPPRRPVLGEKGFLSVDIDRILKSAVAPYLWRYEGPSAEVKPGEAVILTFEREKVSLRYANRLGGEFTANDGRGESYSKPWNIKIGDNAPRLFTEGY